MIAQYIGSCLSGALSGADCGPVWQLIVIAALIGAALGTLVVVRLRAGKPRAGRA